MVPRDNLDTLCQISRTLGSQTYPSFNLRLVSMGILSRLIPREYVRYGGKAKDGFRRYP